MARKRVAILISGRGSNMSALIKAAKAKNYPAEIALVISNRPEAKGLELAQAESIPARVIDHKTFPSREEFDASIDRELKAAKIDLVCLAGFMRVFTDEQLAAYERASEPKKLVMLDGGHFDPYLSQRDNATAAALDWFRQHLKP